MQARVSPLVLPVHCTPHGQGRPRLHFQDPRRPRLPQPQQHEIFVEVAIADLHSMGVPAVNLKAQR